MHSFCLVALTGLVCAALATDYWKYGSAEYGGGRHGHDHDKSYNKGYMKGFEHERIRVIGSTYGDDHGHGAHGHEHGYHY
ncbi:hypothetical protein COOONC_13092 [Cooperia oncophora]